MADDRYEFLEPIGTGGMAVVWRARDRTLGRPVAIKRLLPHLASDPSAAQRFRREARAAAALTHPGIVTVYDTGEDDQGPYIVLELVEGRTLADRLREGPVDPSEAAGIVASVADALDHAHAQGVIHRDVKPSNLILDGDGRIRLTDFGIAMTLEDPTTVTSPDAIVGTISYLAPEIIDGGGASPASDIYSLAAVTYEMLTGTPPYRAEQIGTLLEAIRAGDTVPMEGVPAGMADTVRLAMSTDPADRPESAGVFAMGIVADTTLRIEPPTTLLAPISQAGSEEPTVVMTPGQPVPGSNEIPGATESAQARLSRNGKSGRRWSMLLGVSMIGVALFIWAAMAREPTTVSTDTSFPAAAVASTVTSTSTSTPTTSTSITTATSTTVATTLADTPEAITATIYEALAGLRPPEFHPREVNRVENSLMEVTEKWNEEEGDVEKALEKLFERVTGLPESEERDEISAMAIQLAETMGVQVDQGDKNDDD